MPPPLIIQYPRRYHPISRPLSLHSSFLAQRHVCLPHSLYTIYPMNPNVTAIDRQEVQVNKYILSVTCANDLDSQPSMNLLLTHNKRQMTSRQHISRRYIYLAILTLNPSS